MYKKHLTFLFIALQYSFVILQSCLEAKEWAYSFGVLIKHFIFYNKGISVNNRSIIFSFLALFFISANAMELATLAHMKKMKRMPSVQTFSHDSSDGVKFFHNGKNFFVKEKHQAIKQIHNYDVDPLLEKMTPDQLDTFQKTAGFLVAKRLSNGEYKLNAHVKVLGGGPVGANIGFWTAKAAVWTVGHGTIVAISTGVGTVLGPVAGGYTAKVLESTLSAPIEYASNVAAISAGIFVGASTPI